MPATDTTVHDRFDRARTDLTLTQLAAIFTLVTAAGFLLLFVQEPLVHDSMHNFRHTAGITCH